MSGIPITEVPLSRINLGHRNPDTVFPKEKLIIVQPEKIHIENNKIASDIKAGNKVDDSKTNLKRALPSSEMKRKRMFQNSKSLKSK